MEAGVGLRGEEADGSAASDLGVSVSGDVGHAVDLKRGLTTGQRSTKGGVAVTRWLLVVGGEGWLSRRGGVAGGGPVLAWVIGQSRGLRRLRRRGWADSWSTALQGRAWVAGARGWGWAWCRRALLAVGARDGAEVVVGDGAALGVHRGGTGVGGDDGSTNTSGGGRSSRGVGCAAGLGGDRVVDEARGDVGDGEMALGRRVGDGDEVVGVWVGAGDGRAAGSRAVLGWPRAAARARAEVGAAGRRRWWLAGLSAE